MLNDKLINPFFILLFFSIMELSSFFKEYIKITIKNKLIKSGIKDIHLKILPVFE